jgi:hypothetical protein
MRLGRIVLAALLSTGAPVASAPSSDDNVALLEQRRALDTRLNSLGQKLHEQSAEDHAPSRWAQWYNWGNWSNGFSNWRNW